VDQSRRSLVEGATVLDSTLADPQQLHGNTRQPFDARYEAFLFLSYGDSRVEARGRSRPSPADRRFAARAVRSA
jgi:hypothetical protein